ncbi:MAG TPA: LysR family transcriptional regulator [Arachidicoccus soli]|nr:LysR family transcriptional regulator [Arachidicoccus soli]
MYIKDFIIFQAVVEHGSFTKAAAITNTVQSNVTARIKFLEEEFGAQLLNRTTKRIELTEAGQKLLKAAKELQLIIEETKSSINGNTIIPKGIIKIGCIHTTAALRAPSILENFTNNYPEVEFRLKTGTSLGLMKEVLSYKLDGAFVAGGIKNTKLIMQPVIMEELCIVTPSATYQTLEQLKNTSKLLKLIVFNNGCSYRERLQSFLKKMEIEKYKFIEMDTLDGIMNTVEAGLGITLMPVELIKKHYSYRQLTTIPLPKRFAKIQTVFVRRKDFPVSEGYHLFLQIIINGYKA